MHSLMNSLHAAESSEGNPEGHHGDVGLFRPFGSRFPMGDPGAVHVQSNEWSACGIIA